nr:hypothetical protein [Clostridia bacterium]
MKDKIIKILLIIIIIFHAAHPILEAAIWGYEIPEMLSDIYNNGVIVILSAAILRLYNSKEK